MLKAVAAEKSVATEHDPIPMRWQNFIDLRGDESQTPILPKCAKENAKSPLLIRELVVALGLVLKQQV